MAGHRLASAWTKIASAGDAVSIVNVGNAPALLSNSSRPIVPGGQVTLLDLRSDLSARAADGSAEIVASVTKGLPKEL